MSQNHLPRSVANSALVFLMCCVAAAGQGAKFREKEQTVPLSSVVAATESALNDYQAYAESPDGVKNGIPPLSTADFDFKTVVDLKGGPTISLFVFTLGATWDKQTTNDLDFQYSPHVGLLAESDTFAFDGGKAPKSLYQSIVDSLKASAMEIKRAQDLQAGESSKLDLCQLSLTLSFGITTDVQGGVKVPFEIVTVSASLDKSRQNVQQVKLTFKVKDPSDHSCVLPK